MLLIIIALSLIMQVFVGYQIGGMCDAALRYASERSAVLVAAFYILIFFVIRFVIDRYHVRLKIQKGLSPVVLDVAMYVVCTILLVILLELYGNETLSVSLATMLMLIVLSVLYEKDTYMGIDTEKLVVPVDVGDDFDDEDEEKKDGEGEKAGDGDATGSNDCDNSEEALVGTEDVVIDTEDEIQKILKQYENMKSENEGSGENTEEAVEESAEENAEEAGEDEFVEKAVSFVSDRDYDEDEEDEYDDYDPDGDPVMRYVAIEIVKLLMYVASVALGVLVLRDIHAQKYGALYYAMIILVAVLAVVLRAVYRGLKLIAEKKLEALKARLEENPDDSDNTEKIEDIEKTVKKIKLVCYFLTVAVFTGVLCYSSILIGLVFLLGAFIVKMIIPWVFDNWGSGGTVVVSMRKDTVSRLVTRVFMLIMILLAVWQLSYGALWETEFLSIIAISVGSGEFLLRQNTFSSEV